MQQTIPQHDYRLEAAALAERRYHEVSCRDFRESVLRALPHSWHALRDTRIHAAHFARHKASRGAAKEALAGGGDGKAKAGGGGGTRGARRRGIAARLQGQGQRVGAESDVGGGAATGDIAAVDVAAAKAAAAAKPNALVAHTEQGLEIVNMFSGACPMSLAECCAGLTKLSRWCEALIVVVVHTCECNALAWTHSPYALRHCLPFTSAWPLTIVDLPAAGCRC